MNGENPQRDIGVAIISSFTVTGSAKDLNELPTQCKFLEAYTFMRHSIPGQTPSATNAVEALAELHRQGAAHEVAEFVLQQFPAKTIVAFATFIPEISASDYRQDDLVNSLDALKVLVDAARILRKKYKHPIRTIELVSGSRIEGVFRHINSGPSTYWVRRQVGDGPILRLLERLKLIAGYAMGKGPDDAVFLSVEMEPGPLFALSGWRESGLKFWIITEADRSVTTVLLPADY